MGLTLRTIREMRGLKPAELAALMGIGRPYLVKIELGHKRLNPILLSKAAAALDVRQAALIASTAAEESAA